MTSNKLNHTKPKPGDNSRIKKLFEYATLSKPKHRLTVWLLLTLLIFISKFSWLENLSILKALGWESAPSIGLTRAYWFFIHGNIREAYEMNPLIFIVLVIGIPILLVDVYKIIKD